jgi:hypothetical protein
MIELTEEELRNRQTKFSDRKIWNQQEYFSHIEIPETWKDVTEFADWYMSVKMPLMLPVGSPVYVTNNATAFVMFKKGQYQVEMYIVYGKSMTSNHSHPGMDVITMQIGNMNSSIWGMYSPVLESGQSHSADFTGADGAVFLTFEKWEDESLMSSASVNWNGQTSGPIHDELIKKYRPDIFVEDGYALVNPKKYHKNS